MVTIEIAVSQEDTRIIKEFKILNIIENMFKLQTHLTTKKYEDFEISLNIKSKITLTKRECKLFEDDSHLIIVFNETDLAKYSSEKITTNKQ
jgi:hypothetical protein